MRPISETYRYIVRSAGVRSGHAIVEGTRIAVPYVIGLLQNGETVEPLITSCFPQLMRSQVYECLASYENHRGEIRRRTRAAERAALFRLLESAGETGLSEQHQLRLSTVDDSS